jgi:hypothetical protein
MAEAVPIGPLFISPCKTRRRAPTHPARPGSRRYHHGTVRQAASWQTDYLAYLQRTSLKEYTATEGNRGCDAMNAKPAPVGWAFWIQWVLASAASGAVTLSVTGTMVRAGRPSPVVVAAIFGLLLGASLGLTQWLALRQRIPMAYLWVLVSILGGLLLAISAFATGGPVGGPSGGAIIGAALGIMQWVVLRRYFSHAYVWWLASIVGFALGLTADETVGFGVGGAAGWPLGGACLGIVSGAITGAALAWLFRRPLLPPSSFPPLSHTPIPPHSQP